MFLFDDLRKKIIDSTRVPVKDEFGNIKMLIDEEKFGAILSCFSIRNIFLQKYRRLIQIELLSQEEKKELWEETKRLMPGKTKQETIEGCKVLYTIGMTI